MKKIFTLAALVATSLTFAQSNDSGSSLKPRTISVRGMYSEPSQFGISYEAPSFLMKDHDNTSNVINISYGTMDYDFPTIGDNLTTTGSGFVIELGSKTYFNKARQGFYYENFLSYGNIKFDDDLGISGFKFEGTYSYFSFFSPEVGYKIVIGNFVIDPFIGGIWKIEVKGKGDIDNKNVDEWAARAGVKVGFNF